MINAIPKNTWISWLFITLVTVIIYSGTISYGILYNYDDDAYFSDSRINQLSEDHVKAYFSDYYLGMYQPLPVLSFAALLHLFPGSAEAQRIANILIHCLNALLVLILVKKLTGNHHVANLTALLFAIHPMHVESVSWIATRSNLMYSFFFLLAVILYIRWQEDRHWWKWLIMLLSFLIALFCKVTAATFPLVLILVDWFMGRKFDKTTILLYLPLVLLSALFIRVGVLSSTAFGHITELGQQYTFPERLWIILHAVWLYLSKAIVPVSQSVIYLFPWKEGNSLPPVIMITGGMALIISAALLVAGWKLRKKETGRAILFGFLFFLITISIVMPLKWSRTIIIAERYTYIPYIGLFTGLLMMLFHCFQGAQKWIKTSLLSLLAMSIILFSYVTFNRNRVWKNPVTLFTDVIQKDRSGAEVSMGYYNRGNEYLRLMETEKALADYTQAILVFPAYADAWYNRGLVYHQSGLYSEAIRDYSEAVSLKKDFQSAYLNRGTIYRATGDYNLALSDFNQAISIRPYGPAYFSRGVLYHFNLENTPQACADWDEAMRLGYEPARELLDKFCR
jgi:protein O-mannosyl-transferase